MTLCSVQGSRPRMKPSGRTAARLSGHASRSALIAGIASLSHRGLAPQPSRTPALPSPNLGAQITVLHGGSPSCGQGRVGAWLRPPRADHLCSTERVWWHTQTRSHGHVAILQGTGRRSWRPRRNDEPTSLQLSAIKNSPLQGSPRCFPSRPFLPGPGTLECSLRYKQHAVPPATPQQPLARTGPMFSGKKTDLLEV